VTRSVVEVERLLDQFAIDDDIDHDLAIRAATDVFGLR
jgi:hypothetical protein